MGNNKSSSRVPNDSDHLDIAPEGRQRHVVKALCDYTASGNLDISFCKGDRMEVLNDTELNWWAVLHLTTKREGLIPANYVADENSLESEDWFFPDISRKEADMMLLADSNSRGTFLVRPAQHKYQEFSLDFKDWEKGSGYHVKHYDIKTLDNCRFYFIVPTQTFPSLPALVESFTKNGRGTYQGLAALGHVLGICDPAATWRPCLKPKPHMWELGPGIKDKWEINLSEIHFIRSLGQGNFGEVYYCKWRNQTEVAVKTLRKHRGTAEAFLQEAPIAKHFRHKRLITYYAVCLEEPVYIVLEYMNKGSLLEFLRIGGRRSLNLNDLIDIAAHVASGMEYLESHMLIHTGLAARNVLMDENNEVKISDFGLSRVIDDNVYCPRQGLDFHFKWAAPEAILYDLFSIKSDVWSYGVLLMELFTYGGIPYPGISNNEVIELVEKGYRMQRCDGLPHNIYRLMLQCWEVTPRERPSFKYLNNYFESYSEHGDTYSCPTE